MQFSLDERPLQTSALLTRVFEGSSCEECSSFFTRCGLSGGARDAIHHNLEVHSLVQQSGVTEHGVSTLESRGYSEGKSLSGHKSDMVGSKSYKAP